MDSQSKSWFDELESLERREADSEKKECCKTILFGDLASLNADVHNAFWDACVIIRVNFCPQCGRSIKVIREEVIEELKENYGSVQNFIKHKSQYFDLS